MVWEIKELVGELTPLVFDREFSAQGWLETLEEAGLEWVVRLNTKNRVKLKDEEGQEIPLFVEKGERKQIEGAYYRGEVKVNIAGVWLEGFKEPLWLIGNLAPSRLAEVYLRRMKIEQTFKDAKSLLNIEKVMSKRREQLEVTLALVLLAYGLGLMIGEGARDEAYSGGGGGNEKRGRPQAGGSGSSTRGYSCCSKEAAKVRSGSMENRSRTRAGPVETAFVSALIRKCLISWRKVSYPLDSCP